MTPISNRNPIDILVTDDDFINRAILKHMLQGLRCNIHYAENGKEAIDFISINPNLALILLLDINMPIMNGFQVLEALRENKHTYANVRTIVITGGDFPELKQKMIAGEIDDYLTKPIDREILLNSIIISASSLNKTL